MSKKIFLTAGLGLALGCTSMLASATDPVLIDFDGAGGTNTFQTVGTLDWLVGSSLSQGAIDTSAMYEDGNGNTYSAGEILTDSSLWNQVLTCVSGCDFNLYSHAELVGASNTAGGGVGISGLNTDFEWTFILGGTESVTNQAISQTGDFDKNFVQDTVDVGGTTYNLYTVENTLNFSGGTQTTADGWFFEIYYDASPDADALSGIGYSDGTNILASAQLDSIGGNFTSALFSYADLNSNGVFDAPSVTCTNPSDPSTCTVTKGDLIIADTSSSGFVYELLDMFDANNWNNSPTADAAECDINANGTECYSVVGRGSTTLESTIDPSDVDPDFIKATSSFFMISDLVFSTQNVDPFKKTQPSACYDTSSGGATTDCNHVFGSLVNQDGTISGDVINGSATQSNCQFLGNATEFFACLAQTTAGEDILFETDANNTFVVERVSVPEPGTLAMLGIGLGLLGLRRREKRIPG